MEGWGAVDAFPSTPKNLTPLFLNFGELMFCGGGWVVPDHSCTGIYIPMKGLPTGKLPGSPTNGEGKLLGWKTTLELFFFCAKTATEVQLHDALYTGPCDLKPGKNTLYRDVLMWCLGFYSHSTHTLKHPPLVWTPQLQSKKKLNHQETHVHQKNIHY